MMSSRERTCPRRTCGAWREWDVDHFGHLYVARYVECCCSDEVAAEPAAELDGSCQDCSAPCRTWAKRCTACGNRAMNDRHRVDRAIRTKNAMTAECEECGGPCKATAVRCSVCSRAREKAKAVEYSRKYQAKVRVP